MTEGPLATRLDELAHTTPDGLAVADGVTAWTWRELREKVRAAAIDVRAGTIVPFDAPASPTTVCRLLATLRAGAVAAPLPVGLTPGERAAALDVLHDQPPPAGTSVVVLTSGTTGRPKGVAHSEHSLSASALAWRAVLPEATGWVLALGLAHVAGLGVVWRAVGEGVPILIAPGADTAALLAALRDMRISHASLVPTQLGRLLDAAAEAPPNLRAIPLGGGVIPETMVQRAIAAGWPVVPTYGLSEMGSGVTALAADEAPEAPGSAGRPMPGVSLTIAEPDGEGVGEIVVAGASAFLGYLGEEPRAPGAPFRTGDLGRLDRAGRLSVIDRRTDRIVRGGENISPAEIEAVLLGHPAVADAGVVARRDELLGQVPVAAIVLRDDVVDPGDDALAAHCRAALAGFKVPTAFVRLDVLPRPGSGKLRRADLRALLDGMATGGLDRPGGDRIGWRVSGDGPRTIVLFHGTLSTAQQLDRLAAALAGACGATVHALDRRGSGTGRLAEPRPLDVAVHVADVIAYLDARGIRRADLVGVSFGGVVALEVAARRPERVGSVAAYEPPYGVVVTPEMGIVFPQTREPLARAYALGGAAAAAEAFMRAVAGDDAWDQLPGRTRAFLEGEGVQAVADGALVGLDPAGLARISAPVLLMTGGASDAFYAPIADELARRLPGALRVTLDGLAHPGPIVRPDRVAGAIAAFIERLEPAAE